MHTLPRLIGRAFGTCVPCLVAVFVLLLASPPSVEAAVTLIYFRATGYDDHVLIEWATGSEIDHAGFSLHREAPGEPRTVIHTVFDPECWLGCPYSFEDYEVEAGVTYSYWLESHSAGGGSTMYGPVEATPGVAATATPTSTPTYTATPTKYPTATPALTATRPPTSTPTRLPTATPTYTATGLPSATSTLTPTTLPTATPAAQSSPRATPVQTSVAMSELLGTPTSSASEITATPISTALIAAAPALPAEGPGRDFQSEVAARPGLGGVWPTLSIASALPCISIASFLGVLLLAIALPVVRKRGR